jgi:Tfp pilus assembly protein PilF
MASEEHPQLLKRPPDASFATSLIAPLLLIITFCSFAGVLWAGFVNYDDPGYITDNAMVLKGLTFQTIPWAFTHRIQDVYGPLPPISFALDVRMFGLEPAGFHLENLLLHCANVSLLYLLLRRLTASTWRSALVSALWAIHPCRVESVAWVTERKDMLMALFGLSSFLAYVEYVNKPHLKRYLVMCVLLALSLLAKPTLMVMPALLIVLDVWPLGRTALWPSPFRKGHLPWRRLVMEKVPIAVICTLFVAIYISGPKSVTAPPNAGGPLSLSHRIEGVLIAYAQYVVMIFDFRKLAVAYPIPLSWPIWRIAGSSGLLAFLTLVAFWNVRARPWLAMGWSWFVIMLAPVIGILYATDFAWVDHFTYLSSIGFLVGIVWSLPSALGQKTSFRAALIAGVLLVLSVLFAATSRTVSYWQDSTSLWSHALAVTHDNWLAECNYGLALQEDGQPEQAMPHFLASVQINPGSAQAHYNYAVALQGQGDLADAIAQYRQALQIFPLYSKASLALGTIFMNASRFADAAQVFASATQHDPAFVSLAHCSRGADLLQHDRPDQAIDEFHQALQAQPDYFLAHMGLGVAFLKTGQPAAALAQFQAAQQLNPNDPAVQQNLNAARAAASSQSSKPTE